MEENISEEVAQLQYENMKLLDELKQLKRHILSVEENYNTLFLSSSARENHVKSLEQQVYSMCEALKEKDQTIEALELSNEKFFKLNEKIKSEQLSLKKEVIQEQEMLKIKEEEFKATYAKIKEENARLLSELTMKSEECLLSHSNARNLLNKIKELEDEKLELVALKDNFLHRITEEQSKKIEEKEKSLIEGQGWVLPHSQSEIGIFGQDELFINDRQSLSLREEILEVEVKENKILITQLENLLLMKEKEILRQNELIRELKEKLKNVELLIYNFCANIDFQPCFFDDIPKQIVKFIQWPEAQSGEFKSLKEVSPLAIIVKDGIQTNQPGPIWVVETTSIASQTDPIKNLSPVVRFKTFKKNEPEDNNSSDSDDDLHSISLLEETQMEKCQQIFSDHKNCDLDMDIFRSCRKLSVLPEEDNDDFVIRKISFKSHQTHKCNGFKLKTHSVDDVYKFRPTQPSFLKETSSCKNIISDKTGSVDFCPCDYRSYFQNDVDISTKENAIANKSPGNESERSFFFPAEGFGQPLSLDYSDTESCQIGHTPWMISNPERNETIVLPTVRRGSYKKSRSTCRPLRLPCAKDDKVCKVRFDLSEHSPKNESVTKSNNEKHHSSLKVNKNIRTVSRFRVEIVDELEFRKSIENDNAAVTKNKSLASSVLCTQSVENGLLPLGLKNHTTFSGSPILRSTNGSISQVSSIENADISRVKNEKSLNEICLLKRQKQSDSYSNNERNPNCNDVLFKSIKLHTNGEWIVMKDIKLESLDPPHSVSDFDIPYIDAEDMPVLKPNAELFNATSIFSAEEAIPNSSPTSPAGNSENIYLTPSNLSPVLNGNEFFNFNSSKYCGLSKSPTVLKNLSNFEIFSEIFDSASIQKLVRDKNLQEDEDEDFKKDKMDPNICHTGGSEGSSVDISEASGSDTLTYGTVRSNFLPSSDCDSDTYVTIWSERSSLLDRKFSDLSENSSPSYNTPPETFSGGFCTPPDNYSPILNLLKDSASSNSSISFKTIGESSVEGRAEDVSQCICVSNKSNNFKSLSLNFKEPPKKGEDYVKLGIFFDSSKRGFHEKSDVKENLEITLLEGDGLPDLNFKGLHRSEIIKKKLLRTGEFHEISQYERNSFRSFSEFSLAELGKQQSVLPKENSADEYNFLEPHDSCLNLSEEISSPSTTPDTSNKTVIFKNVALTVSNAIDLEDEDDYFTSKTEKQVNLGDSSLETLDTPATVERTDEIRTCREDSSICSSSITIPKLRASFPNETLTDSPFNSVVLASASPNSMASSLTSDSENSNSAIHSSSFANFVGSEFHLSNVDLLSVHSDNCGSLSHRSNIITCDSVFISDTEKSTAISISRISRNLCSHASNNILPTEKSSDDLSEELSLPSLADTSNEDDLELSDINNVVHVSGLKIPSSAVEGASN